RAAPVRPAHGLDRHDGRPRRHRRYGRAWGRQWCHGCNAARLQVTARAAEASGCAIGHLMATWELCTHMLAHAATLSLARTQCREVEIALEHMLASARIVAPAGAGARHRSSPHTRGTLGVVSGSWRSEDRGGAEAQGVLGPPFAQCAVGLGIQCEVVLA